MKKRLSVFLLALCIVVAALVWANRPGEPLPPGARADRILLVKSERSLTLFSGETPLKSYTVALGRVPVGLKEREGDRRTPEGHYSIDGRLRESRFHRALHVSYPEERDKARAGALGVPPGGSIMIHGITNGFGWIGRLHRLLDWTQGCVAVTNPEIEEIWEAVPDGTPLEILP